DWRRSARGRALPQGAPCTAFFVGGPTPGRSFFELRIGVVRREVAPPTRGAPCTAFFVGGPTPGRSFSDSGLAPLAAGRASHRTWPLAEEPTPNWRTENSLPDKPSHFRP